MQTVRGNCRLCGDLEQGTLIEILPDHPPLLTPLKILYPQNCQVSPRVRAFIEWAVGIFAAA